MRYPIINKKPQREVNISSFTGGLNLRDGITNVRDNQLTDCVNVWFKDGSLRTRPPFVASTESSRAINGGKRQTRFHDDIKVFYEGYECVLATNKLVKTDENGAVCCDIEFELQAVDKIFVLPSISGIKSEDITYFCAEMGGAIYCYISNYSIWKLEYSEDDNEAWKEIKTEDRYVPTVYLHCKRNGWDDFEGTFFEGYNLIGNSYKMIYSAYNLEDSDRSHPMRYALGQELPEEGVIKVEITTCIKDEDETNERKTKVITTEHVIEYDSADYEKFSKGQIVIEKFGEGNTSADGLRLFVKYNYVGFVIASPSDGDEDKTFVVATLTTEDKIQKYACNEDNVVITAPYKVSEGDLKKVLCMTQGTWYGGSANGINGGTRLFLCGNTEKDEKSLVVWSGLNEPLYFGENCYAYVGGRSHAVTTFGKQGESLIIFKENKIYSTRYVQNTEIDADSLTNQTVVDFDASSVYFPMTQINAFIGCDCPNSVQMCRNRVVWANSEGRIFTLCTVNQYNEHTVYEISDMVMPKLKEYKQRIKNATSADFDGHYVLFLGDCAFVMNYCCYGYQYVYSYSKTDDANVLIPWYFWDFDFLKNGNPNEFYNDAVVCENNGSIIMRARYDFESGNEALVGFAMDERAYGDDVVICVANNELKEKNNKISSRVVTKIFELGQGIYNVNVDMLSLKLGANDTNQVDVRLITEQGDELVSVEDNRANDGLRAVNFIKCKTLRPSVKSIVRFGVGLEWSGLLCIEGLSVRYRVLGGNK